MLFLVLLQTALLLMLAALVFYWRLQTNRTLHRLTLLEPDRISAQNRAQAAIALLQSEIAEIKDRANRPEPLQIRADAHPQPASALTIAKRSQALKMIRRGDPVELIAASVGAPHAQIRLLQKVHAMIDAA